MEYVAQRDFAGLVATALELQHACIMAKVEYQVASGDLKRQGTSNSTVNQGC
jgi:hypothetical protein